MTPEWAEEKGDFDAEAVHVGFETRADLMRDEMTDEDWINLGKMVADLAAEARGAED